MRLDSPFVLAFAGTLAIHLLVATTVDAIVVNYPYRPAPPAPRVELVDIEVPKPPPEPPKPPPPPVAKPDVEPPPKEVRPQRTVKQQIQEPPPTSEPPPQETPPQPDTPGGDEVVTLDEAPPGATGVAVKVGKRNTGSHIGRGGQGGGTGAGSGSGVADTPPPVSVATIKTRAMPRGDYGYFADYPLEAKQLGIEGDIRVRLIVDDKGKVKQAVLLNRLGHGLDELALSRAKQIEFDPAKDTEDKPVTSVVVWTFHMTLPK